LFSFSRDRIVFSTAEMKLFFRSRVIFACIRFLSRLRNRDEKVRICPRDQGTQESDCTPLTGETLVALA
jgi:hypothetical protein